MTYFSERSTSSELTIKAHVIDEGGMYRKTCFSRDKIYALEEGNMSGLSVIKRTRAADIVVRIELEALQETLYANNIKDDYRSGNVIDLTSVTKPAPVALPLESTGKILYVAPEDVKNKDGVRLSASFNKAADCVKKANEENYLGFNDWRLPTDDELIFVIHNKTRDGLRGTFVESNETYARYYWTSKSRYTGGSFGSTYYACARSACGGTSSDFTEGAAVSLRLVRG